MKKLLNWIFVVYAIIGVLVTCFDSVKYRTEIDEVAEEYIQKLKKADVYSLKQLHAIKISGIAVGLLLNAVCWPQSLIYRLRNR